MRTDSNALSSQAIKAARVRIKDLYGDEYLTEKPRTYKGKTAKGAQEAHEAIRPAGTEMTPPDRIKLKGIYLALYDLIWKRTIASQLPDARLKQVSIRLSAGQAVFGVPVRSKNFRVF